MLFPRFWIGQLRSVIVVPNAGCGWRVLAVSWIAVAGCTDPPTAEAVADQRYDSAGVTVVVSHEPPAHRVLSTEPRASIGVASGDDHDMLYTVSGARLLDNGRILVANCLAPLLRWYDTSGVYLMGAGNVGEGPSEFPKGACARDFQVFALSDGRVETWEHSHRRLRVFDSSGVQVDARVLLGGADMRGPQLLWEVRSWLSDRWNTGFCSSGSLTWRGTLAYCIPWVERGTRA